MRDQSIQQSQIIRFIIRMDANRDWKPSLLEVPNPIIRTLFGDESLFGPTRDRLAISKHPK